MAVPSYAEVHEMLCGPGQFFEYELTDVRGIPTRTWKIAAPSLREVLTQGRTAGGDGDLFRLDGERMTHAEHFGAVAALATALVDDLGVEPGDRVAIATRNVPEWSVAFFAATAVGAVAVALNSFWNGSELAFGVTDSGARVVLVDGERLERLAPHLGELGEVAIIGTRLDDRKGTDPLPSVTAFAALVDRNVDELPDASIHPDDPATIFYTSGTTDHPKGVLGTHRNICSNLVTMMFTAARSALREGVELAPPSDPPVALVAIPLFHASGCHAALVSSVAFGTTMVFMRKWDPEEALDLIEAHRITAVGGVPAMAWDLLNAPSFPDRDLRSVTSLGAGGAAAPPELLRRIREVLPGRTPSAGFGMTETSAVTTYISGRDYDEHPDSVGVPIPVCELRLVDDHGDDVAPGEPGEIWIKGPTVVPGYWNRPVETAATFTDGWVHTGDIGRIDDDGYLFIVDRAKDIIIRGGENISSIEVEAALYEYPGVLEVAVVPVAHDTLGEEVGAVVRLAPDAPGDADDLRRHATTSLAPYKVPTHVWLVDDPLPRGASGKLLKRDIRATYVDTPD